MDKAGANKSILNQEQMYQVKLRLLNTTRRVDSLSASSRAEAKSTAATENAVISRPDGHAMQSGREIELINLEHVDGALTTSSMGIVQERPTSSVSRRTRLKNANPRNDVDCHRVRRAARVDRIATFRDTLETIVDHTIALPLQSDRRFDERVLPGLDPTVLFGEVLPSCHTHAIPFGTGAEKADDPMDDMDQIVSAIDAGSTELGRIDPQIAYLLRNSRALSTRRLYRWAWLRAIRSCKLADVCPLPMSEASAAMVLVDAMNDGLCFGSIRLVASVISVAHETARLPDPMKCEALRSVLRGMGRLLNDRPEGKVALDRDELVLIREACDRDKNRVRAVRDWAIIAFGFAGAFRRSEIVSRNVDDLEFVGDHMRVWINRSKTDQLGRGAYITIHAGSDPRLCPVAAVAAWIALLPSPGPLFRRITKHQTVDHARLGAATITDTVKAFGIVLDLPEDRLGAHSLRAGMITALIDSGMVETQIMVHSRHTGKDMLKKYYRPRKSTINFTQLAGL